MVSNVIVQRRFPAWEAIVRTDRSREFVRAHLPGAAGSRDSFVVRSRKRGVYGRLAPRIDGHLTSIEPGSCDVEFRVSYPRGWWVLATCLFILIAAESFAASDRDLLILLPCLLILLFLSFVPLALKGSAFAQHVKTLLT